MTRNGKKKLTNLQDRLPYMDDSRAVSPVASIDGGQLEAGHMDGHRMDGHGLLGRQSRHNSWASHTSRMTYNSHAELTNRSRRLVDMSLSLFAVHCHTIEPAVSMPYIYTNWPYAFLSYHDMWLFANADTQTMPCHEVTYLQKF